MAALGDVHVTPPIRAKAVCLLVLTLSCLIPDCGAILQSSAHVKRVCKLDCRFPPENTTVANVDVCVEACVAEAERGTEIVWIYINSVFVFMMQIGFAFLEAGTCREIHRNFLLRKNVMDALISPPCFWAISFVLDQELFQDDRGVRKAHTVLFHALFCATSVTIASGAIAERIRLSAYYCYVVIMSGFVYPLVMIGAWDAEYEGLLSVPFRCISDHPYHDAAGSGVVHLLGGTSGLVAAALLGRRIWRPPSEDRGTVPEWIFKGAGRNVKHWAKKEDEVFNPDVKMQVIGTFLLGVGWFGFNAGSVAFELAGLVAKNTFLAWCLAGMVSYVYYYFERSLGKMESVPWGGVCNGSLCGLVAITAGCDVAQPHQAALCGVVAGLLCPPACSLVQLWVDDTVDASVVHAGGGLIGLAAVAFLQPDCSQGQDLGESQARFCRDGEYVIVRQLAAQLLGALFIFGWAIVWSVPMWSPFILAECCKARTFASLKASMDRFLDEHRGRNVKMEIASIRNSNSLPKSYITEWLLVYLGEKHTTGSLSINELENYFYPGFHDEHASVCSAVCGCLWLLDKVLRSSTCCCCCESCLCSHWGCFSLWSSFRNSPKEELYGLSMELNNVLPEQCKRFFEEFCFWRWHRVAQAMDNLRTPRRWTICGASIEGLVLILRLAQNNEIWREDTIVIWLVDDRLEENEPGSTTKYRYRAQDREEAVLTPDREFIRKFCRRPRFKKEDAAVFEENPEGERVCDLQDRLLSAVLRYPCVRVETRHVSTQLQDILATSHIVVLADPFCCTSSFEGHGISFPTVTEPGTDTDYTFCYNVRGEVFPSPDILRALNHAQNKYYLQSPATRRLPAQEANCTIYFRASQQQWRQWQERRQTPGGRRQTRAIPYRDAGVQLLNWPKDEVTASLDYFFPNMTYDTLPETLTAKVTRLSRSKNFIQEHDGRVLCISLVEEGMGTGCFPWANGSFYSALKAADALAMTWIQAVTDRASFLDEIHKPAGFNSYLARLAEEEMERSRPWVKVQGEGGPGGPLSPCGAVVGGRVPSSDQEPMELHKNILHWLEHERRPDGSYTDEEKEEIWKRVCGLSLPVTQVMNDSTPAAQDDTKKGWPLHLLQEREHKFLDEPFSL